MYVVQTRPNEASTRSENAGYLPMTVLLLDRGEPERQALISSVATKTTALSTPEMLDGGEFTFPQEAYVAVASNVR